MENKTIVVKNAANEPDTEAEILYEAKIDYTPKVSVIIPVYNTEEYLKECLDSVVNQTLKEIEIICVNDGSIDSSLEILKEYAQKDNRITLASQKNSGSGIARNCGLGLSKGEFVGFMDPDDYYPKNTILETLYTKTKENNVLIAGGSMQKFDNEKGIFPPERHEPQYIFKNEGIIYYKDYQFDYGYSRFIYNNKFLKDNNILFPNFLRRQDPPFFIKAMSLAKKFYVIAESTYSYRVSYKEINWTEKRISDLVKSMTDSLKYTSIHKFYRLHSIIASRLCTPFYIEALKNLYKYNKKSELISEMVKTLNFKAIIKYNPNFSLPDFYKFPIDYSKISIIICAYNAETFLSNCLDSVINQTYKNLEIICVDDGSNDNTHNILLEYAKKDSRIKFISHKNVGLANSRNDALKIATGEYVQFVDADDYLREDTLELLYQKASVNNLDMISFGGINFINGTNEQQENPYYEFQYLPKNFNKDIFTYSDCRSFIHQMAVSSCLTMYRHAFIKDKEILFPPNICFEDNLFFCKAVTQAKKIGILKDRLYFRRVHSDSITQNAEKHLKDYIKVSCLMLKYLKKIGIDYDVYENYLNSYTENIVCRYNSYEQEYQKKYYKGVKRFVKKYNSDLLSKIHEQANPLEQIFSITNQENNGIKILTIFGLKLKIKCKQIGQASFLEKIFSIKNQESKNNKWYKVIRILGLKFSIQSKSLTQRKAILRLENQNSNLLKCNFENKKDIQNIKNCFFAQKEEIECLSKLNSIQKEDILNIKKYLDVSTQKQSELKAKFNEQQKIIDKQKQELLHIYEWQQNFYKKDPSKFPISLSESEKNAIKDYINNSKMYLEFGAGGSTFLAADSEETKTYSIESDVDWINYLISYKAIATAIDKKRLDIIHVNIGETKEWGYPINDDLKDNYPKYSNEIFDCIKKENVDLVLIDGRFRVACALATILNCSKKTKIMIHDYTFREYYHILEEFLEIIKIVDTLAVFKIKENIDLGKVQFLYDEYKYIKK